MIPREGQRNAGTAEHGARVAHIRDGQGAVRHEQRNERRAARPCWSAAASQVGVHLPDSLRKLCGKKMRGQRALVWRQRLDALRSLQQPMPLLLLLRRAALTLCDLPSFVTFRDRLRVSHVPQPLWQLVRRPMRAEAAPMAI